VLLWNVEEEHPTEGRLGCDVLHHNGVLYHLKDPVRHLRRLLGRTGRALLLDTHVARENEATAEYVVDSRSFAVKRFQEGGMANPFSGAYDHALWLRLEDLRQEILDAGFRVDVEEQRDERHGSRVLFLASRP
jgi:tRNA (mo5U34)-methyltransferase